MRKAETNKKKSTQKHQKRDPSSMVKRLVSIKLNLVLMIRIMYDKQCLNTFLENRIKNLIESQTTSHAIICNTHLIELQVCFKIIHVHTLKILIEVDLNYLTCSPVEKYKRA